MTDRVAIAVYSPPTEPGIPPCIMCKATRRQLDKLNVPYDEREITDEVRAAALELELSTSPVVCVSIDGREFFWGGHRPDKIAAAAAGDAEKLDALSTASAR